MSKLNERLDRLRAEIQTEDFIKGRGLSNEVNIRMFCYENDEEMAIRYFVSKLKDDTSLKYKPVIFNLFKVLLDICEHEEILEYMQEYEEDNGKAELLKQLQSNGDNKKMVEEMKAQFDANPSDIVILTGVGEVFPFCRVHMILEAMQQSFGNIPVVTFYPGKYDGLTVRLFGELEPNNYYRAFNLV